MSVQYSPGPHPVAVTPHGFVVLAGDTSAALASRIHALVADGRGLGGVLEALTGAYGTSLSAVPPFAVALAEQGAVRLAVRGGLALDIEAGSAERISGEGVTTWTERVIPEVSRVTLVSGADAPPAEYPVTDGVVLAASLVWVPAGDDTPVAPASRPETGEVTPAAASAAMSAATPSAPLAVAAASAPAEKAEAHHASEASVPAPAGDAPAPAPGGDALAPTGDAPSAVATAEPSADESSEADLETIASVRSVKRAAARSAEASAPRAAPPTPAAPGVTAPGLIDSAAVLSLADADTLLPAESTLIPRSDTDGGSAEPVSLSAEPPPASGWEATVVRSQDAVAAPVVQGDHDGATVSVAKARALRNGDSAPPPLAPPRPPAPGRIRVSSGQVMTLDRTVVIGRRPRSTRVSGTDLPHLIAVDSPQQDISRSHVELRVEGDSIVATDLHTTNGTTLLRSGVDPMRLHPGEGAVVVPGDVIDLGDGITVAIEELP